MKKKLHYIYLKPQNYYNRLFTFFLLIGFSLTFFLMNLVRIELSLELFLLHFISLVFLLLVFAVIIEYFYLGEYMTPHERLDIMIFINQLLENYEDKKHIDSFVNKYNHKTLKFLKNSLYGKKKRFVISNFRKVNSKIIVTLLDDRKVLTYFFIKFLSKKAVLTLYLHKEKNSYKVIRAK